MLVRDAFGYALPGAVFIVIGVVSGRIQMTRVHDWLWPYAPPAWMAFLGIVLICYAVGGILAAVSYSPWMVFKYIIWMADRHPEWAAKVGIKLGDAPPPPANGQSTKEVEVADEYERAGQYVHYEHREHTFPAKTSAAAPAPEPAEGSAREWLLNHPTEVAEKIVEIRAEQTHLMDTLDRRETLALLSASMTIALLGGYWVFYKHQWSFGDMVLCAGWFVLLQFLTGMPHLRRVAKSTKEYYESTKKAPKPQPDLVHLLGDLITSAKAVLNKLNS